MNQVSINVWDREGRWLGKIDLADLFGGVKIDVGHEETHVEASMFHDRFRDMLKALHAGAVMLSKEERKNR